MDIIKKVKSNQGFSMSEMLLAVLIILLTLGVMGGGITVVKDAYHKITLRAEAQTLLSTAIASISTELRNAQRVEKKEETGQVSDWNFYSAKRGYRLYFENKRNNIYIKTEGSSVELPLLTEKTITNGLVLRLEDLTYEKQIFTYMVKIYYKDEVYAQQEIVVRPMNTE